ncbi:MAG: adenylate/guanylate cyclase domain-containing protein [Gaiellaceae bacterium]
MDEPIRYAKSGDVSVAYQVTGEGQFDLVLVHGFFSHLELDWEHPSPRHFFERLGSFARLIRFDKRGTGLSDREVGMPDFDARMDDVRAVMDAVGSERAALFGYSEGGPLSVLFAATYPERTRALVLYGSYAKRLRSEDYPWAPTLEERRQTATEIHDNWGVDFDLAAMAPNADESLTKWAALRGRGALSPTAAGNLILMNSMADVRSALPLVQAPTLVLHRTGDRDANVAEGRYLAEHIPDARFVELDGEDHLPFVDPDQILDEVEEFLTGVRPTQVDDRVLATVLFTDIVESTRHVRELGDRGWAELLERHHEIVRHELVRHAGQEVDTAGDGFLALFDGPARAIRCALSVRDRMGRLGLDIRAGVHTGEVEQRQGGSPRGIAVHVGARVASAAGPGEVLTTATTRDLVAGSGLVFQDRGELELKGVGPRRLYAASA